MLASRKMALRLTIPQPSSAARRPALFASTFRSLAPLTGQRSGLGARTGQSEMTSSTDKRTPTRIATCAVPSMPSAINVAPTSSSLTKKYTPMIGGKEKRANQSMTPAHRCQVRLSARTAKS